MGDDSPLKSDGGGNVAGTGGNGSLFARYELSDHWALRPELTIGQSSCAFDSPMMDSALKISLVGGALAVPVALVIHRGRVQPQLFAGPAVGAVVSYHLSGPAASQFLESANSPTLGATFGFLVDIGGVAIELRVDRTFTALGDGIGSPLTTISLGAGYGLAL